MAHTATTATAATATRKKGGGGGGGTTQQRGHRRHRPPPSPPRGGAGAGGGGGGGGGEQEHLLASSSTTTTNVYALLRGLSTADDPAQAPDRHRHHRHHHRQQQQHPSPPSPPPRGGRRGEKEKEEEKEEDEVETVEERLRSEDEEEEEDREEEEGVVWLDSFVWSAIFSHLHDGPLLARLRLVCARWRGLIDEDKRLWKALLLQDFGWRKDRRRGKGRAKKNKKEHIYQELYISMHRQRQMRQKNIEREQQLQRERLMKSSRLLTKLMPLLIERHLRSGRANKILDEENHPWRICPHPHDSLLIPNQSAGCVRLKWCECEACGVSVWILDHKYWWTHYLQMLDVTYHCSEGHDRIALLAKKVYIQSDTNAGAAYVKYAQYLERQKASSTNTVADA